MNVLPRIKRGLAESGATMRGYFCLFHEATLVNLLAVCLHHAHAAEALGEVTPVGVGWGWGGSGCGG